MAKEHTHGLMENPTQATGSKVSSTEKDAGRESTETLMLENGEKERQMEKALMFGQMETSTRETGSIS